MPVTPEQQKYLNEVLDPRKVSVYCGTHMYFGPSKNGVEAKPAQGCSKCWFVLYFHDLATTPPELRAARLDELDEVVHKCCELADKGKFDIDISRYAKFETETN